MLCLADRGQQRFSIPQRVRALKRIFPQAQVERAIREIFPHQRTCPVAPNHWMLWTMILMGLFAADSLRQLWRRLRPGPAPQRSTLTTARKRLGLRPLVILASRCIQLLARADTPNAFYRGMRLMGVDSVRLSVADTPDNRRVFGPWNRGRKAVAAYPQVHLTALCELGTHVFFKWQAKPTSWGDARVVSTLLRELQEGMLLMWDCNFYSYGNVRQVLKQRAHLLGRLSWSLKLPVERRLADGSYLSRIYCSATDRKKQRNGIVVRIIEYRLSDSNRKGSNKSHRLITTLLDPQQSPAAELVELYHVRWEIELSIDELETHQLQQRVLASQSPRTVLQEIWGLMLGHYAIRWLMFEAAEQRQVSPLSVSFTGTLQILCCRLPHAPRSPRLQASWWAELVSEVSQELLPPRRDRFNPRVLKRVTVDWPKKRPQHYHWPQPTQRFRQSIVILQ